MLEGRFDCPPPTTRLPTRGRDRGHSATAGAPLHAATDPAPLEETVELLLRARGGDEDAWSALVGRCVDVLGRFAHGRLPHHARAMIDTQDIVQDAIINTVRQLHRFDARRHGALLAYLRRAVRNRIIDEVRKALRGPTALLHEGEWADTGPSPLEQAIRRENSARWQMARAQLSARDRAILTLWLDEGASYRAVAAHLGMPTDNAARMALRRALYRLARVVAGTGRIGADSGAHPSRGGKRQSWNERALSSAG